MVDKKSMEADNAFFVKMMDLIPAAYYFDKDTKEDLETKLTPKDDVKLVNGGGQKRKGQDETVKSKKKRAKYDPSTYKTVSQIHAAVSTETKTTSMMKGDPTLTLDTARDKLHQKLQEMHKKRLHQMTPEEYLEKKKLKRKMRNHKRREKRKQKKEKMATDKVNGVSSPPAKPVLNKEGKMVFSKFDFTDLGVKDKSGKHALTGKNYKRLLQKVESRKQKLDALRETDAKKADELAEKNKWQTALHKAEGIKVKDDVDKLKKAAKRKEKIKEGKKKKWDAREQATETRMKEKQDKRKKNIKERKDNKVKKKIDKAKKKGRIIPGF